MRLFGRKDQPTPQTNDSRYLDVQESMKRATMVTHVQEHLSKLVTQGKYDEYIEYATGVYPADVAADRPIRVN